MQHTMYQEDEDADSSDPDPGGLGGLKDNPEMYRYCGPDPPKGLSKHEKFKRSMRSVSETLLFGIIADGQKRNVFFEEAYKKHNLGPYTNRFKSDEEVK